MNIQRVKQGARITLYNGAFMIILGAIYIFLININMKLSFREYSELWGFFSRYNPKIAYIILLLNILIGLLFISIGIIVIYLSDFIIKRKDKMAWLILFLSGILAWGGVFIISIFLKSWLLIFLGGFGWVSFLIGMLIPIKYYLEKNYHQY